jgi:D-alanyl-D-alanine carboxypeptidase
MLVATLLSLALVAQPSPAGPAPLQRDLDAVLAAGVTGAVAEAHTAAGRGSARAGVADLRTGRPVAPGSSVR